MYNSEKEGRGLALLRAVNWLYRFGFFPLLFQFISLGFFILLIIGGFGISTEDPALLKVLRNTNLSNLIVWSYWWPLIVIAAVSIGRHWCTICPIELISSVFSKYGLKREAPRFLRAGWGITILYIFVSIVAVHTWGIHRSPHKMALYLSSLMGAAVIISLVFEKRGFCSYFCPVGKLLGLYSLLSPLGIRVKDGEICKSCIDKDCVNSRNSNKLIGRSCSTGLYPPKIKDNRDCILCTQCIKACPNENTSLRVNHNSFGSFNPQRLMWSEVGMLSVLMGFVSYEILSSWKLSKGFLLSVPDFIYKTFPQSHIPYKLFEGVILFMILPLVFILLFSFSGKISGKGSIGFHMKLTVGYLLPLIGLGHLFKGLLKTISRIPYWEYAINKPDGMEYGKKILAKEISINQPDWIGSFVIFSGSLVMLIGIAMVMKKILKDESLNTGCRVIYMILPLLYLMILLLGPASKVFN